MVCPVCKNVELVSRDLEANLISKQCPTCGGQWLPSEQYWRWRNEHGPDLPEKPAEEGLHLPVVENAVAKLCPDCGHVLLPYHVGHELRFSLDHCGHCGGTWLDKNEWEILKSRNLHDNIPFLFSHVWQAEVFHDERKKARERLLLEKFGEEDFAAIRRIKAWLDSHPHKQELYAFLLHAQE